MKDYSGASRYQEELLNVWWKMWLVQVFPHLLPYYRYKAAKHHENLRVGDICRLHYEGMVRGTYHVSSAGNICQ